MMIGRGGGFNHFDGLVETGIEGLAFSHNWVHRKSGESGLQLLVNQLDSGAKLGRVRPDLHSAFQTIDYWQQRFDGVGGGVVAEILLLFAGAAAGVFKLCLGAAEAVEER